mgnify:CR=1 FL=1
MSIYIRQTLTLKEENSFKAKSPKRQLISWCNKEIHILSLKYQI